MSRAGRRAALDQAEAFKPSHERAALLAANGGEGITLSVAQAPVSDVGKGCARVDASVRRALRVEKGDIVEIRGTNTTAAVLSELDPQDQGKDIIRVDGLVRRNLGVSIGDQVEVRKAETSPAERVTIAPIVSSGHKISFGEGIEKFVKRGLLKRPVAKGDVIIVPGIALMGGALPFMVIAVTPEGIVQITDDSLLEVDEKEVPASLAMLTERPADEIYSEFVRILRSRLEAILAPFQEQLASLPAEHAARVRSVTEAIRKVLDDAEVKRGP